MRYQRSHPRAFILSDPAVCTSVSMASSHVGRLPCLRMTPPFRGRASLLHARTSLHRRRSTVRASDGASLEVKAEVYFDVSGGSEVRRSVHLKTCCSTCGHLHQRLALQVHSLCPHPLHPNSLHYVLECVATITSSSGSRFGLCWRNRGFLLGHVQTSAPHIYSVDRSGPALS